MSHWNGKSPAIARVASAAPGSNFCGIVGILKKFARRVLVAWIGVLSVLMAACGGSGAVDPDNSAPIAEIQIDALSGVAPFTVLVDGSASRDLDGQIVEYYWTFAEGVTANQVTETHTYEQPGTYTITLRVVDDRGAEALATVEITADEGGNIAPVASIAANVSSGLAPLNVQFSALNSKDADGEIVSYRWNFGDGESAEGGEPSHIFDEVGDYPVHVTVVDDAGAEDTAIFMVRVLDDTSTFRLRGTISTYPYTDVDGDVNDPNAPYFNNNATSTAEIQPLNNPVLLNGFVTASATGGTTDAFRFDVDTLDVYEIDLAAGEYVSLRLFNAANADLDLFMYEQDLELVTSSIGTGEFESMQAPEGGRFYVAVESLYGASEYLLNVGRGSFVSGPAAAGQGADFEPNEAIVKLSPDAQLAQGGVDMLRAAQVAMSHRNPSRMALARFDVANATTRTRLSMRAQSGFDQRLLIENPEAYQKLATLRAIKKLRHQTGIEQAEPNFRVKSMLTPTDPAYRFQWHLPALNLPQTWDQTLGNPEVSVAVVDSGVFLDHSDLQGQLLPGYDFIANPETAGDGDGIDANPNDEGDDAYVGSSSWHGTHVAGIVAAALNNDEGGVGLAPGVKIMPLRALGKGGGTTYDVMQAVRYAAGLENDSGQLPEKPADVINLSLGGAGYLQSAQDVYRQARDRGVVIVAAAGNEDTAVPIYPASYDGVVSVAAGDYRGERAPYSNRGPYIDVMAPGGNLALDANSDNYADGILSSVVDERDAGLESSYAFYQGTSMAAPVVSGVIALMKSVYPEMTPDEFDSLLISGAITADVNEPGRDDETGYGIIDAFLAVQSAQSLADGSATAAILVNPANLVFSANADSAVLRVQGIGSAELEVDFARGSENWITIEPLEVDGNGIGTYRVAVDREGLVDGNYKGYIEIASRNFNQVRVPVNMRVGEIVASANAGFLYILLIDAATDETVAFDQRAMENGEYNFEFTGVPLGEYYVVAGSDINNNGFVCDQAESCGYYPSIGELSVLRIDTDRDGLDFSAGLNAFVDNDPATQAMLQQVQRGIPRKQLSF